MFTPVAFDSNNLLFLDSQGPFHFADHHYNLAFDLQGLGLLDEDRFHGRVGGLEAIALFFFEEIFQPLFDIVGDMLLLV